ncbi:Helix-turn-helix domain-containing protein [Aliiroseovarius crassostreae]|uniref:helix-turn-helix domain-containing protein n=1 Tax=Aliiroseovarius crassostreae TaxID=154981 RepID=UPI0008ED4910|nr:helix-turn-helix domain-containing protein [Aliiroseovarius crassostreae]SFU89151.1 Helix-turn-helix domain-containing protein [Aliiroseovarius crassostreae]
MSNVVVIAPEELRNLIGEAVRDAMKATAKPEAWLPVATVAERLGKSEKTIRNWIKEGRFTRVSGGDGAHYLVSSLEVGELSRLANSSAEAS